MLWALNYIFHIDIRLSSRENAEGSGSTVGLLINNRGSGSKKWA
jgi:hypothetical protein